MCTVVRHLTIVNADGNTTAKRDGPLRV